MLSKNVLTMHHRVVVVEDVLNNFTETLIYVVQYTIIDRSKFKNDNVIWINSLTSVKEPIGITYEF